MGHVAWLQLSRPFKLSNEAWTTLQEMLKSAEPLFCGIATQVMQANKEIPGAIRKQIVPVLLSVLQDEKLSYRSLRTPDDQYMRLDDALFQLLQTLVEQDEQGS